MKNRKRILNSVNASETFMHEDLKETLPGMIDKEIAEDLISWAKKFTWDINDPYFQQKMLDRENLNYRDDEGAFLHEKWEKENIGKDLND